jgi:hypothetical protein
MLCVELKIWRAARAVNELNTQNSTLVTCHTPHGLTGKGTRSKVANK